MEQQQQQRLEIEVGDLYALIGQLTVENRVLRVRLRALEQQPGAASNGAGVLENGDGRPVWRDLEPAEAP